MALRLRVPLPGPFSYSARIGGRRRYRGRSSGSLTLLFTGGIHLMFYLLVAEAWVCWWMFKSFYVAGVLIYRHRTGRQVPIWRSRNGWW
ncbi:hypothetical protein ACE1OC_28450 [Streptomyces sp. DSM 116496]|uniref:hypothetical protein n=1 Tax=Streptomyces stoeckheimensis TaxID=3344656 RepID=UPI0038B3220D